jgi:hypothetical protein
VELVVVGRGHVDSSVSGMIVAVRKTAHRVGNGRLFVADVSLEGSPRGEVDRWRTRCLGALA